ncbi:hypothetical protein [Phytohabitans houttuyneae]|uniref:Uncharacterized protein n=1 Tax=Phytohabitans houttuyneae TaxID=1076126 RepID=A0A6V8KN58_9ACTN|nr:hypothetical protein [Phytohabitans houttuyneae]GFJ83326.1 hypothetical protein Phou_075060 [Phytohabitans houttuyneae]
MASSGRARLAAIGAAVLLLLALAVAARPAGAGLPVPLPTPIVTGTVTWPDVWVQLPCATGAITGHQVGRDERGAPTLRIQGWIQPCAGAERSTGFAVVRYFPDSGLRSRRIEPYASMSAPTPFDFQVDAPGGDGLRGPVRALCVAYAFDGRAACVGLDPGDPLSVTAIPPSHPRVLVNVGVEGVYNTNPTCGTCV